MRKLLILVLLLGTNGYAFSEESQLKKKHITKACALVAVTPNFQAEQKFIEEYYKLQDLAGHDDYKPGFSLGFTFSTVTLEQNISGLPWASACEVTLQEEFAEDLVN